MVIAILLQATNIMRTVCEERTEHASGNDGSQPDAQRAAGRAAGGGGHGASSGVMHESTEVREHITVETNAKPERRNSVTPFENKPVVAKNSKKGISPRKPGLEIIAKTSKNNRNVFL